MLCMPTSNHMYIILHFGEYQKMSLEFVMYLLHVRRGLHQYEI